MSKRVNNTRGKPSKNRGPLRRKVFLSTRFALAQRARQARAKALVDVIPDLYDTQRQVRILKEGRTIEKRGWKDKTRSFFSGIFKQGQRGR